MKTIGRRNVLQAIGAAVGGLAARRELAAQEAVEKATRGTPSPKIRDVRVIATAPAGSRLVVVRIDTDQDGLHGYGCATFTQRADVVITAVEKYLKPFLMGKPADRIEDTWEACYASSYWRNGPVLNNAISGVDMALWDIKGRQAGRPGDQLLGGKCREAAGWYTHAGGAEIAETIESARRIMAQGFRYVRVQVGLPGMAGYGSSAGKNQRVGLHAGPVFEPEAYIKRAVQLLEASRKQLGDEVELLHDVHERVEPIQAVRLAKAVEPFRLFYLEDALSPENIDYFRMIREQSATQLAMGELFNSPHEWTPLISGRLIDFVRMHVSQTGGLTPCRKIAAMAEMYGVRTAWHGPGDLSPVGVACSLALDLTCHNFGVQEYTAFNERVREVFEGVPEMREGYLYANEAPGWGIEVNEKAAAKYPYGTFENPAAKERNGGWGEIRRTDGTIIQQ